MKLNTRVEVCTTSGELLYRTHRADAQRMLNDHSAVRVHKARIRLVLHPGSPHRRPSVLTVAAYMGQRYTFREQLASARVLQLKRINPADRGIFRLAVTDCLRVK